jgi:Protein of unknown function (DUF3047)
MLEHARTMACIGTRHGYAWVLVALLAVPSCAWAQVPLLAPLNGPDDKPPAPWAVFKLPKQTKPVTVFSITTIDGRRALRIESNESYGTLAHIMGADAPRARTLAWRWRVDQPITKADLHKRSGDDTAVKVCALYEIPADKIPVVDRAWLRAAQAASGTKMPSACVCYVWDSRLPVHTVLPNAFTRRVRYIVVRSGESALATWTEERRDLDADFLHLFGDEVDTVPRLVAIAIGGDADNTRSHGLAYVADLELSP